MKALSLPLLHPLAMSRAERERDQVREREGSREKDIGKGYLSCRKLQQKTEKAGESEDGLGKTRAKRLREKGLGKLQ